MELSDRLNRYSQMFSMGSLILAIIFGTILELYQREYVEIELEIRFCDGRAPIIKKEIGYIYPNTTHFTIKKDGRFAGYYGVCELKELSLKKLNK